MKYVKGKIPAVLASCLTALSLGLVIASYLTDCFSTTPDGGSSVGFGLWALSVVIALISVLLYAMDFIHCPISIIKGIDRPLNIPLALIILGSFPLVYWVAPKLDTVAILLWNIYNAALLTLETVAIVRHIKAAKKTEQSAPEEDYVGPIAS